MRAPTAGSHGCRPDDRGAISIIVAGFTLVAVVLLAFVVDRGLGYAQRTQLQNAMDSAALAAVQMTCGNPIADATAVRNEAIDFAAQNGVTLEAGNIIVQDGPSDATTGVSVAAEQPGTRVFGSFAGVGSSSVAARSTATRTCYSAYRMVSSTSVSFSGGKSVSGPIYAGQCFRATGSGGTYEAVAVSVTASDTTTCAPPAGSHGIEPGNNTVTTSLYNVAQPTLADAYASTPIGKTPGYTETEMNAKLVSGPFNCSNFAAPIVCNGDVTLPNATITVNVLASGTVTAQNNTVFNGAVIYSQSTADGTPSSALTVKAGGNAATVYYAPNGKVQALGAATASQNAGIIIGNAIDFNGGSQNATGGAVIRAPGAWRLAQ